MKRTVEGTRRGLSRSRHGILLGVCKGIAEYLGISVFWVRMMVLALLFFTKFWPVVGLYILAALLMKLEPVTPIHSDEAPHFYNSHGRSQGTGLGQLKRAFDNLDRRIRRMEDTVTTREYDWERRLNG